MLGMRSLKAARSTLIASLKFEDTVDVSRLQKASRFARLMKREYLHILQVCRLGISPHHISKVTELALKRNHKMIPGPSDLETLGVPFVLQLVAIFVHLAPNGMFLRP
jgi:hypothetical protein